MLENPALDLLSGPIELLIIGFSLLQIFLSINFLEIFFNILTINVLTDNKLL